MTHLTPQNLDIRVSDAVIEGGNVSYRVGLSHPLRPNVTVSYVMRRFSDLEPVMKRLKALPAVPPLPGVPEKKFFGSTAPDFVEQRRQQIELFLRAVAYNQDLCAEDDFLQMVGYPPPPSALAAAGVDLAMSTSIASNVGGSKASPRSPRNGAGGGGGGGLTSPSNVDAIMQTTPWIRGPPQFLNHDQDISAAQGWVRGTPFRLVRALPPLSYRRNCKTNFLLEDPSQAQSTKLVLSVYTPDPQLSIAIPDEKKLSYVIRTVSTSLGSSQPNFASPLVFTADKGRMFVVRKYYPSGSLLDLMFGAGGESLVEAARKYASKPKPLSQSDIAIVGKQLLLIVRQCHEFNIPLPNLHIGNIFLGGDKLSLEKSHIVLSDVESTLLGLSASPCMLPVSGREEADTMTHIDVLRVGIVLLTLAVGMPIRADIEVQLLRCCGTPWMPSWAPPKDDDDDDESVATTKKSSKSKHHHKEDAAPPAPGAPCAVSDAIFNGIQEPLLSLLKFMFLPTNKCEVDTLLGHSFFKTAKLPKTYRQTYLVDPADQTKKLETGVLPSLTGLKKKDVELFSEAAGKWTTLMEAAEAADKRRNDGKAVAKELKKIGREKRKEALLNGGLEDELPSLSSSVSMIATPVEKKTPTTRPVKSPRQQPEPSSPAALPVVANTTTSAPPPLQQQQQAAPSPPPVVQQQQPPPPTTTAPPPAINRPAGGNADLMAAIRNAGGNAAATTAPPPTTNNRPAGGNADLMAAIRNAGGNANASSTSSSSSSPPPPATTTAILNRPAGGNADLMAAIRNAGGNANNSSAPPPPARPAGGNADLMAAIRNAGGNASNNNNNTSSAAPPPARPAGGNADLMAAIRNAGGNAGGGGGSGGGTTPNAPPPAGLPKRPPGHADMMAAIRAAQK